MKKFNKGDALIVAGLLSLVGGIAMIHIPAAAIVLGLILIVIGYLASK